MGRTCACEWLTGCEGKGRNTGPQFPARPRGSQYHRKGEDGAWDGTEVGPPGSISLQRWHCWPPALPPQRDTWDGCGTEVSARRSSLTQLGLRNVGRTQQFSSGALLNRTTHLQHTRPRIKPLASRLEQYAGAEGRPARGKQGVQPALLIAATIPAIWYPEGSQSTRSSVC